MKNIFKNIFLVAVFCFFSNQKGYTQGNLQFNQVILYDFAASATQAITVPSGKVWKIEAGNSYNGSNSGITIRNSANQAMGVLSTSASVSTSVYPFWLPSGFTGSLLNGASTGRACLSIIEFNIVP